MKTIHDAMARRNNFDAIRLCAAMGVTCSHSYLVAQGSDKNEFFFLLSGGQSNWGQWCVAVFFIISGFLITQSFFRSPSLFQYVANRVLRIIPALAVVTVLTVALVGPLVTRQSMAEYWTNELSWRFFANSVIYFGTQHLPGVFTNNPYPHATNVSTWTLAYEFSCYIGVAALGLLLKKSWKLAIPMLALCLASVFLTNVAPRIFVTMSGYFVAGSVMYLGRKKIPMDFRLFVLSVAALLAAVLLHRTLYVTTCVFGSYAVIYAAYSERFQWHNAARHGDFSYGIYLYSWPIQQLLVPYLGTPALLSLATLPLALLMAAGSWTFVEKPALAMKTNLAQAWRRWRANEEWALSGQPEAH